MKLESYNNLLELFFDRYQLENKNEIFLQSLKNEKSNFTWKQTFDAIQNLSLFLDQYITTNDRCLLISENRPEWLTTSGTKPVREASQGSRVYRRAVIDPAAIPPDR